MIFIISNEFDESTNQVQEWLFYLKKKHIRLNPSDFIIIKKIDFNRVVPNIFFSINNGGTITTNEIKSFWYRRGDLNFNHENIFKISLVDKNLEASVKSNLQDEIQTIKELFWHLLEKKSNKTIGSYFTRNNNKLIHLSIAKSVGLNVPKTRICTERNQFLHFYKSNNREIITKPISNLLAYWEKDKIDGNSYAIYTNQIKEKIVKTIPTSFFPTILQQKIDKRIELRIFYLKGKFYSMAIFSQQNKKTNIDFRKYDIKNPNYNTPFKLPKKIENKLDKFMNLVQLNTGSIDMVYSTDGKYYFLEVNPVGQFGVVSYSCNYNLEKIIATELICN